MKHLTPYTHASFFLVAGMILAILLNRWGGIDLIAWIIVLVVVAAMVNLWSVGSLVSYRHDVEEKNR